MTEMPRHPLAAAEPAFDERAPIGTVLEVNGAEALLALDPQRIGACMGSTDAAIALAGQVGGPLKIRAPGGGWLLASVRDQRRDPREGLILARADFMGEGEAKSEAGADSLARFRRGITRYPVPGEAVHAASTADLVQVYATSAGSTIRIGTVHPTGEIAACLDVDALLSRHFALLGSTGTGKSTAAALILHRICESAPDGHILMIDPHGEYAAAFRDTGAIFDVSNLQMPYWLMNFEEHCEAFLTSSGADRQEDADILSRCLLQARSRNRLTEEIGRITVDSPIPYLLSDLTKILNDEMGKLDKATSSAPFLRIKSKIDEMKADPRYQFMFSGMLVGDTMAEFIARIFRMPGQGKPIAIIDVSGVPSDITATVVAVLSRMVFDFALWSRQERTRPILLVCEEAHRYIPNERKADSSAVARILSRIAKEGRKYGIALGLITQRPSDLAEGVLSQCGTIISMRLNNERDQAFVRAAMPEGARGFLDAMPALRNREAVVCGEGVSVPMRLRFDDLEEAKCPASTDPSFADLWRESGGEVDSVARTVRRWRAQGR